MTVGMRRLNGWWTLAGALLVAMAVSVPASAQLTTGRIDVRVTDATGAVLPGATVVLSGTQSAQQVTDANGEARFLNLAPGPYEIVATLAGFSDYRNPNVPVVAGGSVPLRIMLTVAGVQAQIEVTAESPVVDPKRQLTGQNVTLDELQNIPSSRDPWVVLQTVPGVVVDRVNVGGAESGQQSLFFGKGSLMSENSFSLDGISVTDMSATGATATYYDFDMFQEMNITTGGADVRNPSPGVNVSFVMKTGTNTPHGSARYFFANEGLQSNNLPDDLKGADRLGGKSGKGNRTDQNVDFGGEVGGPIVRDKWWAWGSVSKNDVRILTLSDVLDRTILKNYGLKSQAQVTDAFRPSFTFFFGDKLKFGRGAGPTRPDPTTWNQEGPTQIYKGQGDFTVGTNLFVQANYAFVKNRFSLTPRGGMDKSAILDDEGVWQNSFVFYSTKRPQHSAASDASWFLGKHEVKFGFSWRRYSVESLSVWPGNRSISIHGGYPDMGVQVLRDWALNTSTNYTNLYVGDTMTFDRWTINAGVRYDGASSQALETSVPGVPGFEFILPAINAPAVTDQKFKWNSLSPRIGVTYAMGEDRRTQLRASYAMFAGTLGAGDVGVVSPLQYSYVYYLATDRNGNRIADPNEIFFNLGIQGYTGFDPANPSKAESVHRIGDASPPRTHEALFGFDREVFRNFGVTANFTYRRMTNLRWFPYQGVRRDDFQAAGTLEGSTEATGSFSVPLHRLSSAAVPTGGGQEWVNREGYHQRYWGFDLGATKRLSNRWMGRVAFSTNDHREYFDDPNLSIMDPTPQLPGGAFGGSLGFGPLKDGGVVVTQTTGSGKSAIFIIVPKYQFIANGLLQGPWGVNFGMNLVSRQGFGQPYHRSQVRTGDPLRASKNVLINQDLDENRLPSVTSFDIRLEKAFSLGRSNIIFDFDVFNVTNAATVLGRQYDVRRTGPTGFNQVLEIMNPRIARLGFRLNF